MNTITHVQPAVADGASGNRSFAIDTTFVLFFLAFDCGQRFDLGVDGLLSAVTLIMFLVLPYFLPFPGEKPVFEKWVLGRSAIASLAILLGVAFGQLPGVVIPDSFRFLPLTMLIFAGIVSCYIQLYGMLRLRLAK